MSNVTKINRALFPISTFYQIKETLVKGSSDPDGISDVHSSYDVNYSYYPHTDITSVYIDGLHHVIKWPKRFWQKTQLTIVVNEKKGISYLKKVSWFKSRSLRYSYRPRDSFIIDAIKDLINFGLDVHESDKERLASFNRNMSRIHDPYARRKLEAHFQEFCAKVDHRPTPVIPPKKR